MKPKTPVTPKGDAQYLTLEGVVEYFDGTVSLSTVRGWIYTGKLVAFKPGMRVLVRRVDLVAFVEDSVHKSSQLVARTRPPVR